MTAIDELIELVERVAAAERVAVSSNLVSRLFRATSP